MEILNTSIKRVIVITKAAILVGPTAVGKTNVSFELSELGFEIVSADSVQVYKHLNIGSSKPTLEEMGKIRHYCIDIVEPDFVFTAAEYCNYAAIAVDQIYSISKIPLFVGGTGLYLDSFFYGLSDIPEIDSQVRQGLRQQLEEEGSALLHKELCRVDPVFSKKVHVNDKQRILRGLEVFRSTGKPLSEYHQQKQKCDIEDLKFIGLQQELGKLIERIRKRTYEMFDNGFVDEVDRLRKKGYNADLQSMRTIGYREVNKYLDNELSIQETIDKVISSTAQYAKRQMTWFRRNKSIKWYNPGQLSELKNDVASWIEN